MTQTRSSRISFALAMATAFIASASLPHFAAAQSAPAQDRVWAECTLTPDAVTQLINSMTTSDTGNRLGTSKQVAFVVIYSFEGNDGQPLSGVTDPEGPHTGPVLCRNTAVAPSISQVLQTQDVGTTSSPVDVLDVENALVLRYRNSGPPPGPVQKRYCHTVDANADCFLLR